MKAKEFITEDDTESDYNQMETAIREMAQKYELSSDQSYYAFRKQDISPSQQIGMELIFNL